MRAAVELTVRARHPVPGREHIYKEENVTIPREGATLDVPVQLPATGTVTVAVERQDDGTGIPGVEVFLQDSFSGSFRAEGATDANGERIVSVVPGGAFTVRAERDGQLLGEAGDSIEQHGDEVTVAFAVSGDASVSGTVLAGDGETPVPGARVELRSEDGSLLLSETESALDGSYLFDDAVEPGTSALVRAFLPGAPEKSDERAVTANAAGDPIAFDPRLPVSVIKGRILEADGATLVSGATVETTPYGALYPTASLSSETGDFALFDQELGVHTLAAIDSLGVSSYATGTLVSVDEALVLDLVLPEVGTVDASVFDENGALLANQLVMLRSASLRWPRSAFPDASGIYRFERVALGAFTVTYDETDSFTMRSGSASGRITDLERNVEVSIALPGFTSLFGELVEGGVPSTPLDEFTPLAVEGRLQESSTGIYRKEDGLDIDGDYRVENVPEGAVTLTASENLESPPVVSSATAVVTDDLDRAPRRYRSGYGGRFRRRAFPLLPGDERRKPRRPGDDARESSGERQGVSRPRRRDAGRIRPESLRRRPRPDERHRPPARRLRSRGREVRPLPRDLREPPRFRRRDHAELRDVALRTRNVVGRRSHRPRRPVLHELRAGDRRRRHAASFPTSPERTSTPPSISRGGISWFPATAAWS